MYKKEGHFQDTGRGGATATGVSGRGLAGEEILITRDCSSIATVRINNPASSR